MDAISPFENFVGTTPQVKNLRGGGAPDGCRFKLIVTQSCL